MLNEKAKYAALDKSQLDQGMWGICDKINVHPGVSTVFGCLGHMDAEEPSAHFYLTFVVSNREGEDVVKRIFKNFSNSMQLDCWPNINSEEFQPEPRLEISKLIDPNFESATLPRWVWTIETWLNSVITTEIAYHHLRNAVISI